MTNIINNLLNEYNIESISFAAIPAGGLVYVVDDAAYIIINKHLSKAKALFVLMHEIGHVALGILPLSPADQTLSSDEILVHLWAIEKLSTYLSLEEIEVLKSAFQESDCSGYQMIENIFNQKQINLNFFKDLV
ncbi:MAG: ImmA/IrrE family metallo-endopeptidase [Bdellovibrio sp.]